MERLWLAMSYLAFICDILCAVNIPHKISECNAMLHHEHSTHLGWSNTRSRWPSALDDKAVTQDKSCMPTSIFLQSKLRYLIIGTNSNYFCWLVNISTTEISHLQIVSTVLVPHFRTTWAAHLINAFYKFSIVCTIRSGFPPAVEG